MRLRPLPLLFCAALLVAGEDPFEAPPELKTFAQKQTIGHMGVATKVGYLLKSFFAAPEEGGLGITYDNAYTRTPIEAWRCLLYTSPSPRD